MGGGNPSTTLTLFKVSLDFILSLLVEENGFITVRDFGNIIEAEQQRFAKKKHNQNQVLIFFAIA